VKTSRPTRALLCTPFVLLLAMLPNAGEAQGVDAKVQYAPDIVGVGRLFLIALQVPAETPEIAVEVPDCVKLLDRTPLPAKTDQRRFYFRSLAPAASTQIRFSWADRELVVPLTIWSFEDLRQFRELKGTPLPRRWPLGQALPHLKEGRTVTTEQDLARLRKGGGADVWLQTDDDAIWAMQPDSTIPRWHWVNIRFGCPVHGTDIYEKRAFYPWEKDADIPWRWKIRCPVGGEEYPSNDFGNDDFTSGDFPDDGIGGGCVHDGQHYGFIAETAQFYCHRMLTVPTACARAYIATEDVRYVHKALVAFCRIAAEYAYLATMTHHRHRNTAAQVERLGQSRFEEGPFLYATGFTVYSIDQPGYMTSLSRAYDLIFPAIEQDAEIIPYLQAKGFSVQTHGDVRRFIEENLFAVWLQGAMDDSCHSNEPFQQMGFAHIAEMLNYPVTDMMEWLYDGGGKMRIFVPNTFFRDGAPYESTGGYNGMHVSALGPIVDAVERTRAMRPELFPEERFPSLSKSRRYQNVFDFDMDTVTIDRGFPAVGDTGGHPEYSRMSRVTWQAGGAAAYEHAYRQFRHPKFAWALAHAPGWSPSADFPFTREQIEQEAASWPDDWNDRSSLHDGYGLAILRAGAGDDKRAAWLHYGRARGHVQDDHMDLGLHAYKGTLLQHMGYPRNWGYWEHSWTSHNLARQIPFVTQTAQPQLFADAGPVHLTEARAQTFIDRVDEGLGYELPQDQWQRRLVALVDISDRQFYCVDWYRISGGQEHWWAFHAQEGDFVASGLELTAQERGTLAGPDVEYGDPEWLQANGCRKGLYGWSGPMFGFAHLYNVRRGASDGGWHADWKLKTGEGLHLRLTVPEARGTEVAICDGTSPAGGNPYEMKWVMLHKTAAEPVQTQVLSLIEPYRGEPAIRRATALALSGDDEAGFTASGCTVELEGRTDTLFASASPDVMRQAEGGFRFAGRFGLYAEQEGEPVAMVLVGGTELSKGGFGVTADSAEFRGTITAVDRGAETITVSPAPPGIEAMVGETIFTTNPYRRSAQKVLRAEAVPDGVRLHLDLDSRIGTGRVTGVEDFKVATATEFPLNRYRYYHGARLLNHDGSAEYRIDDVRSQSGAAIDRAAHPDALQATLQQQFPPDSWFEVYDFGVGDEVVWPYSISVKRVRRGVYEVQSPVAVKLQLPGK